MMSKAREEAVWKRVMALSAEAPVPVPRTQTAKPEEPLLQLLEQERTDACTYRILAGRTGGSFRRSLLQLAEGARRHSRTLETVCYLMTGRRAEPGQAEAAPVSDVRETLRRHYRQACQAAAQYEKLAEQEAGFHQIFHTLEQEKLRQGQRILQLLEQCL